MAEIDLPCACGRTIKLQRDRGDIVALKHRLRRDPEALAYIEELEGLWAHAKRQGNVWRGIASAMGYEPRAHDSVKPTTSWLLDRITKFRVEAQTPTPDPSHG